MTLFLGVHVNRVSSVLDDNQELDLDDAIVRDADALGLNYVQIFTHGPRNHHQCKYHPKMIKKVTKEIGLIIHTCYGMTQVWKERWVLAKFEEQLKACQEIQGQGVVLHVNLHPPKVVIDVLKLLIPLAERYECMIFLEMIASKSSELTYDTPEKINKVNEAFSDLEREHFGWCVDTAHLWGAGQDQIQEYRGMQLWLEGVDHQMIKMFHLNGSSVPVGCGKDVHAIVFSDEDQVFAGYKPHESGVRAVVEYATKHEVPIILEVNRGDEHEVRTAIKIINRLAS